MTRNERDAINRRTKNCYLLQRMKRGLEVVRDAPYKRALLAAYLVGAMLVWLFRTYLFGLDTYGIFSPVLEGVINLLPPFYAVGDLLAVLVLLGTPWDGKAAGEDLQKVGFISHAGEATILITKRQDTDNPRLTVWEFDPCGISLGKRENKRPRIETALSTTIAKMIWAEGRKIICIYSAPAESDFPTLLPWKDKYLSPNNFVLVLGESLTEPVTVNPTNIPHILLGGSTGSGKSVLLKLLLMQALRKGAEAYIADFKDGVDFPKVWRQKCHMCFREDTLLYVLSQLVAVLETHEEWLKNAGYDNLDAFSRAAGEGLPRLVFAYDEVAELLDRTGRSKEDRERLNQIENRLITLARLGRTFGIHLILTTQRSDANILPGQVKNNMDSRVCGRADSILSGIILDNTSAAEQIPKNARGRFITEDGAVFQTYLFDQERL